MAKKRIVKKGKFNLHFKLDLKNILIWLLVLWLVVSLVLSYASQQQTRQETSLSQILTDIKEDKINQIEIEDDRLLVDYNDESQKFARKETQDSFTQILADAQIPAENVNFTVKDTSLTKVLVELFATTILPLGLMVAFFFFIFRQARGAQDSIFSFGKSKARLFAKGKQTTAFKDVAGVDEAKKELEEVVDFLKHPQKYRRLGARIPKGVLLVGPAGVGKTLLAKAVAGEAGVSFFSMAGSEFMEMLVGVGASRVRDLFLTAKKSAPAIIFIDEIDAIGRQRGNGFAGGHDEREQTLNQILVEMDGFSPNDNVIVLAATNRGDLLDPALLRPGRFDRRVTLDMPDIQDRRAILKIHALGKPFAKDVNWPQVAKSTVTFSGADLENMLNEAAIFAARQGKQEIEMKDISEASLRVKMGPETKRMQSEDERKMTAYHEAGHAVVSYLLPKVDPVHRVSIVSRGVAMGFTLIPPKKDRYQQTKSQLEETIVTLLGGRAVEEMIFNELTVGASNDIEKATMIARQMVVDFGMSQLGPINFGPQFDQDRYIRGLMPSSEISAETKNEIDRQVASIINKTYRRAKELLKKNTKKLDLIASQLLEKETIEEADFQRLMKQK